jgi:hypothetical protein
MPNLYQNEQRAPLTIFKMRWWMARLSDTGRDSWLSRAVSLIAPSLIQQHGQMDANGIKAFAKSIKPDF